MTQEQKTLLLKDLCARLPYGVYVEHIRTGIRGHLHDLKVYPLYDKTDDHIYDYISSTDFLGDGDYFDIEWFKPLLFPLSSMTEEQANELFNLFGISLLDSVGKDYIKINECTGITFFLNKGFDVEMHLDKLMNWLNTNHFDYRGLIPMGLAIDCTNLNIY